jgi:competence protein ComEC
LTFSTRIALFFYEVGLVSAISQVGLAVPMIVYFHRVGLSGLSANAFIIPILGVAVPLGFIAVFTNSVWLAHLTGWLLSISRAVVAWHASVEPVWRIPPPPIWLGVAFCAGLVVVALARGKWMRLASGCVQAALLALMLWHPFPPETHPRELELTAIDVGQGDSLLVVFPDGKRLLLDGGGIPAFGGPPSKIDIGEDVVAPYLWERGIRSVDVIALSHAHEDHIGGLPALTADFHPKQLWTGVTPESPSWRKLREQAAKVGAKILPLDGPQSFAFGGAQIDILAPFADYVPADEPKNDDSLVMRIRYGLRSFLLCGDVEKPIEYRMLAENELLHADVLKVAHHGSHTSSTADFLDAVTPAFAIISDGLDNSYGHPHRDVIERLEERHAAVYRTDHAGLVTIRTDGRRIWVETPTSLSAGF